ncbi:MAG: terpene cyclase/mutase family protein [Anaerolineae bacterium]|nr:terpene cyclase/mutase family protein [Anaerolineae bacterium]
MDITKSVASIEERGSGLERARIRQILYGVRPEPDVTQPFMELQNDDGGFPYDMVQGNLSTVDSTLVALWWMDELRMLESSTADKAFGYLLAVQRDYGGWDEDPSIAQYDLPPWISPGDLRTKLYLSSYSAYWLAVRSYGTRPAFQKVLDFLLKHRDETGRFYGYLHTTWIATSVFIMAEPQYSEVVRKGLQVLMDRPLSEWADSQIAWALNCLGQAGLPKDHPFIEKCLAELLQRQRPDGKWSSEDGEAYAVGATIEVLKALKLYGLLLAKS